MAKCKRCANPAVEGRTLCLRCKESQARRGRRWYVVNHEPIRTRQRSRRNEDRTEVFRRLGGACVCCGITEEAFLTVDHPNNDGAQHRRKLQSGGLFLWRRMLDDWGTFELRLLCWNCHRAINSRGACPHLSAS